MRRAYEGGYRVMAKIVGTQVRTNVNTGRTHPFVVECHYRDPGSGEVHVCFSRYLYFDPADMLTAAVIAGAILAGADEKTLSSLRLYSEKMGMLFQITDDILDMKGDPKLMGKTLGKDKEQGKLTYASLLGLDGAAQAAKQAADEALDAIKEIPGSGYLAATIENMLVRSN